MNKINICNNCLKQGHLFHQCKLPITSYGIILFRYNNDGRGIEFLMIRRKDSFGYIDFIRGKYAPNNIEQIQKSINEMSIFEKKNILTESFETLWKKLWSDNNKNQYRSEELSALKKFENIRNGIFINGTYITLQTLVDNSNTVWTETEWEFPKGRRNYQEKDVVCALREFEEETGINKKNISIIENLLPFEELYIGSNHKAYKHKYYVAYTSEKESLLENFQKEEVSKIEWKTIDECLDSIRPYNIEKKNIIKNVYDLLNEYTIQPINL
jgi:8-oxo-dGTP pyrophosphatase MutT (NUDIX family)